MRDQVNTRQWNDSLHYLAWAEVMATMRKILIVDDHEIVRNGLRAQLDLQADIEVVGEAGNGQDAIRLADELAPDLVLLDLHMPGTNGIDTIAEIRKRHPNMRILVFTFQKTEEYVCASCRVGANGYILKDEPTEKVIVAIRTVLSGGSAISPCILEHVIHLFADHGGKTIATSHWDLLTIREREVLKLVAQGHTSKYIASRLCRSNKTVEKHRANLMKKLGLHSIAALTQFAMEHQLLVTG